MPSKVIFDSPELLDETLVPLTDACNFFPVPCTRPTLERWIRGGSRGIVLESVLLCGKRYVSKEGIDRFLRNQLHIAPDKSTTRRSGMSKKEIEAKAKKYGLPKPQKNQFVKKVTAQKYFLKIGGESTGCPSE